jgi:hypothetical protein
MDHWIFKLLAQKLFFIITIGGVYYLSVPDEEKAKVTNMLKITCRFVHGKQKRPTPKSPFLQTFGTVSFLNYSFVIANVLSNPSPPRCWMLT